MTVFVTSRRYCQINFAQVLKETNRCTQLLRGSKLIRKGIDTTTRTRAGYLVFFCDTRYVKTTVMGSQRDTDISVEHGVVRVRFTDGVKIICQL